MALTVGMTQEMRLKTGPDHFGPKFFSRFPMCFRRSLPGRGCSRRERRLDSPPPGDGNLGGDLHEPPEGIPPPPLGMEVRAVTKITQVEGKKITFKVEWFDEKEKIGRSRPQAVYH